MLTNFEDVKDIVIDCYRKFKSHVYYSNNLQRVRLKIAEFEHQPEEMDRRINVLSDIIFNESEKGWNELLNSVSYYVLPKISMVQSSNQGSHNDEQIISNCSSDIKIDKVNFFVDVPVEIYILDTLWTVLAGKLIVEKHIFNGEVCANRLNKKIYNSKEKGIVGAIDFRNLSIYYSRYVDDLLVIINSASKESNLESIINEHFSDCLRPIDDRIEIIGYPGLIIQNSKIKVLKLFSNQSKNYINILKQEITNSSETQLLPSVDVDLKNFISQAYLHNEDSLKIRDMDSLNINTLSVMRFIGSYLRSKKNTQDKPEISNKKKYRLTYYEQIDRETQEQLELFFKGSTLFSLYLKWDKIFAFALLYKQDFSLAKSIYDDILENIEGITGAFQYIRKKSQRTVSAALRKALKLHLPRKNSV